MTTPKYPQPFTLEQAILLDVPTITGEISRLQHSLQHLIATQNELQTHISSSEPPDSDLVTAFEENKVTIASQQERIDILRLALQRKGGVSAGNNHYDVHEAPAPSPTAPQDDSADGGLYL